MIKRSRGDRINFLEEHVDEIVPILEGENNLEDLSILNDRELGEIAEQFETKIFILEKKENEYDSDAKGVLLTANDPGTYASIKPMLDLLIGDIRCRSVMLLISGVAEKNFRKDFSDSFEQVQDSSVGIIEDIGNQAAKQPVDVVVGTVTTKNGPESMPQAAGKDVLGAEKVFVLFDGWGSLGNNFVDPKQRSFFFEQLDGVFCADGVAREILLKSYPELSGDKVFITGIPVIDTLKQERVEVFIKTAREKFGLSPEEIAILFAGDISADCDELFGSNLNINERTFELTLETLISLARENPDKDYALLLRPHPRDSRKKELSSIADRADLPKNLRVIPAGVERAGMQEVRFASDVVMSIGSTENFLAPRIGREAVFLGYRQEKLGNTILSNAYGDDLLETIGSSDDHLHVVDSPAGLLEVLSRAKRAPEKEEDIPIFKYPGSSTEHVLDEILV